MEPIKYCVTRWGAVLKVSSVKGALVDISDPDAIDAGMFISTTDVMEYWLGWRPKDRLPNEGQEIEVMEKEKKQIGVTSFKNGEFQMDSKVILWREIELPY